MSVTYAEIFTQYIENIIAGIYGSLVFAEVELMA
jgi:hypothetical protein